MGASVPDIVARSRDYHAPPDRIPQMRLAGKNFVAEVSAFAEAPVGVPLKSLPTGGGCIARRAAPRDLLSSPFADHGEPHASRHQDRPAPAPAPRGV